MDTLTITAHYLRAEGFRPTLAKEYRFELLNARHSVDVVRWRNDPENRHAFFKARILTLEDQANFLKNYAVLHRVDLVLTTEGEGRPVGVFALKNLDTNPELGILLGEKSCRGKNVGTAATAALLHFGFEWLRLPIIWGHTQKTNEGIIRLNTKLGFTMESEIEREGTAYCRMCLTRERFVTKAH